MAERNIHLGERDESPSSASLMRNDPTPVMLRTSPSSDERQELPKLCLEVLNLRILDSKEEEQLSLLGDADENIALNVVEQVIAYRLLCHRYESVRSDRGKTVMAELSVSSQKLLESHPVGTMYSITTLREGRLI